MYIVKEKTPLKYSYEGWRTNPAGVPTLTTQAGKNWVVKTDEAPRQVNSTEFISAGCPLCATQEDDRKNGRYIFLVIILLIFLIY